MPLFICQKLKMPRFDSSLKASLRGAPMLNCKVVPKMEHMIKSAIIDGFFGGIRKVLKLMFGIMALLCVIGLVKIIKAKELLTLGRSTQ